ncbi:CapA family protein [Phocicoccus pinnipedialis]|uniref:Capsule biosynthesis protein CapA n=1 Tax=Phocicoccus pinnipedialis TaxID=110845 RepID=A0A6V7R9W5_9BACL|nr:CapA family protein [Jeotgalicoccus pinnipedialis]CAD2073933.1 Capsule biosynthesis protein CapA [Jeotgalicoccus pinnipedialis]
MLFVSTITAASTGLSSIGANNLIDWSPIKSFNFRATGDILVHDYLYEDVQQEDGSYEFKSRVESIEPYLKDADFVYINQETPIGGEELGLSGYPTFNAPTEVADLLEYLQADVVNLANNHILDRSTEGVLKTIERLQERGIDYIGANISEGDRNRQRVFNVNGIKVGMNGYTYGTNGIETPPGQGYLVNYDYFDLILEDIEKLKEVSDVQIISMHRGVEYADFPEEIDRSMYEQIAEAGIDLIIASHPHTLQPVDIYTTSDGREVPIAYSMSNFFSAQQSLNTKIGGIFEFEVKKIGTTLMVPKVRFMPTYVRSNEYTNFYLMPLKDVDMPDVYKDVESHMKSYTDKIEVVPYLK